MQAIHGYRETEKSRWSQEALSIFQRIRDTAFLADLELLPHVHVLDLEKTGYAYTYNHCNNELHWTLSPEFLTVTSM